MMDIKRTAKFGWIYPESQHFDDMKLLTKDKYNRYTLTRIKVWVGEKDDRVVIQGIQSFFKDIQTGEEITEGERRDSQKPFTSTHEFKLENNEYIVDFIIRFETEVTEIGFVTNKGRTEKWGGQAGELKITHLTGAGKIVKGLFGCTSDVLTSCGVLYIDKKDYLNSLFSGYFRLKYLIKKNEEFKKKCQSISNLNEKEKTLIQACQLPDSIFNQIIKYCMS